MKPSIYVPLAIALGVVTSPLAAQAYPPSDRDRAMMEQDNRMHHHDMHNDRYMERHDSYWRTMRWCRSMPYRRMMRIPRCRWLMRHSGRMDHRY